MLTLQELKEMKPGAVFATGEIENSPSGVYMANSNKGEMLKWIAKRGGIEDWVIYIHWAYHSESYVKEYGEKVMTEAYIRKLVPCEDEAFKMYRK